MSHKKPYRLLLFLNLASLACLGHLWRFAHRSFDPGSRGSLPFLPGAEGEPSFTPPLFSGLLSPPTEISQRLHAGLNPLPTKDELALVNGDPVTLVDFIDARNRLRQTALTTVFWVSCVQVLLKNQAETGRRVSAELSPVFQSQPQQGLDLIGFKLAAYAAAALPLKLKPVSPLLASPAALKAFLDGLLSKARVIKNSALLAKLLVL